MILRFDRAMLYDLSREETEILRDAAKIIVREESRLKREML